MNILKQGDDIKLNWNEVASAAHIGILRHIRAQAAGKNNRNGGYRKNEQELWGVHIQGAMAEKAFCKATNLYLPEISSQTHEEPDVNPIWQVRCRTNLEHELPVRKDDLEMFNYVLLLGSGPTFRFGGWIEGSKAKQTRFWKDVGGFGCPAFFIPQSELNKELNCNYETTKAA